MDQKAETQPQALRPILNPEARALVLAGDCYLAPVGSQPQTIDLGHDPNWEVQAFIQPGASKEKRLHLSFSNNRDSRRVELRFSSQGLVLAYDVLNPNGSGILEVRSAPVGRPQAAEKDFLALRVLPALSLMKPSESRLLEGVLGLASGNEGYQLSSRNNPCQIVSRIAQVVPPPAAVRPLVLTADRLSVEPKKKPPVSESIPVAEKKAELGCYSLNLPGRADEDRVATLSVNPGQNPWGIYFLGGVFDGHSPTKSAGRLVERALPVFWSSLSRLSAMALPAAISQASVEANARLIQEFGSDSGTCAEMALLTKDGLYQLHLGDGQQFLGKKNGEAVSANFTPHQPAGEGRVGGTLRVNHSWGDAGIRRIVGEEALSAIPEVRFLPWDQLRREGVRNLLLTTDGLLDLVNHVDQRLPAKAMNDYLGSSSQAEIRQAMNRFGRQYPEPGADDVSGLLLSW